MATHYSSSVTLRDIQSAILRLRVSSVSPSAAINTMPISKQEAQDLYNCDVTVEYSLPKASGHYFQYPKGYEYSPKDCDDDYLFRVEVE